MYTWGIFLAYIHRRLSMRLHFHVFLEAGRDTSSEASQGKAFSEANNTPFNKTHGLISLEVHTTSLESNMDVMKFLMRLANIVLWLKAKTMAETTLPTSHS